MKKAQVSVFIILGVILAAAILLIFLFDRPPKIEVRECDVDADCVPSRCCDAPACVQISEAPDCAGVECPLLCDSYVTNTTLCQGQEGSAQCACIDNKCTSA